MLGLRELIQPLEGHMVVDVLEAVTDLAHLSMHRFGISNMIEIVASVVTHHKRKEQRLLKKSLCALAVVAGMVPDRGEDGLPVIRHEGSLGRHRRAGTGLLRVGADVLRIVVGFLSCDIKLMDCLFREQWTACFDHRLPSLCTDCHFSPDGNFLVSCTLDGMLRLWSLPEGKLEHTFEGHSHGVEACCFAPDGKTVLSASQDTTLKLWNAESGLLHATLEGHSVVVSCCAFNPDGSTILSGSGDGTLKSWCATTGRSLWSKGMGARVQCCCFSPDGTRILVGFHRSLSFGVKRSFCFKSYCSETLAIQSVFDGHLDFVNACCYSRDGETILSGSYDNTMKTWSVATEKLIRTFVGHTAGVKQCAFTPDGLMVISASLDRTVRLWRTSTGIVYRLLDDNMTKATSCCVSPDGTSFAAGFHGGILKLWCHSASLKLPALPSQSAASTTPGKNKVNISGLSYQTR
jgi:WD40 repeat protein